MSANLVARETGWRLRDWSESQRATEAAFRPVETFAARFDEVLAHVRALGFDTVDLWTAHLGPGWATGEHVAAAVELLDRHELRVASLAGNFGVSPADVERACKLAVAVGAPVLGGMLDTEPSAVAPVLREHGVRLALENHPQERTVEDMLALIGDGSDGTVGTTVDTGWWATHAVDPVSAIEQLARHVLHVHLKDVRRPGGHETCRWGEGVVPIEGCVRALRRLGYTGALSVELEPAEGDPGEDCRAMRVQLEQLVS